jgi:dTDP-4-dehydrorhamnose reductase
VTVTVLLTGASGQLGFELQRRVPDSVTLVTLDRAQLDLRQGPAIIACLEAHQPNVILNCAAYTAVDRAESESADAFAVNAAAVETLASSARRIDARLIHLSTDFVFSGPASGLRQPDEHTSPGSVYGTSKRDGEVAVLETLGDRGLVMRTSWLYSSHGANFVKTMLRLMREKDEVRVVSDQIGAPTWAAGLATTLWAAVAAPQVSGVQHWTDAGVASWYDFAVAIQEEALARRLLSREIPVIPIPTADYPTPARRPAFSVLDTRQTAHALGVTPTHWRRQLRLMLDELVNA